MRGLPDRTWEFLVPHRAKSPILGIVGSWLVVVLVLGFSVGTAFVQPRLVWTFQDSKEGVPHGAEGLIVVGETVVEKVRFPGHQGETEICLIQSDGDPTRPQGIFIPLDETLPAGTESYACTVRSLAYKESKLMLCPATYHADRNEMQLHQDNRYIIPIYSNAVGAITTSIPVTFSRRHPSAGYLYVGSAGSPVHLAVVDLLFYDVTAVSRYSRS